MKVICIDNTAKSHPLVIGKFMVVEGKTYEVAEIVHWYDYDWYLLREDKGGNYWNPRYFIPIDNTKFDTLLKGILSVPNSNKERKDILKEIKTKQKQRESQPYEFQKAK